MVRQNPGSRNAPTSVKQKSSFSRRLSPTTVPGLSRKTRRPSIWRFLTWFASSPLCNGTINRSRPFSFYRQSPFFAFSRLHHWLYPPLAVGYNLVEPTNAVPVTFVKCSSFPGRSCTFPRGFAVSGHMPFPETLCSCRREKTHPLRKKKLAPWVRPAFFPFPFCLIQLTRSPTHNFSCTCQLPVFKATPFSFCIFLFLPARRPRHTRISSCC